MKKGEKRKRELLQIAYRLFLQKGYEETSVDDIIAQAHIAKGTYYYYFETKEQMLEEVIGMMLEQEAEKARQVLLQPLPAPQKIAGIIASLRPAAEETPIEGALMRPENRVMHGKIRKKLVDMAVPLLSRAVEEGKTQGVFNCGDVPERVRMLVLVSSDIFDEGCFTGRDVEVYIDMAEKLLGAEPGTMEFIRELIR